MVDDYTASDQFMRHMQREAEFGRVVPADWGRIVPPLSASATKVFHQEMQDSCLKPNFFPQPAPCSQEHLNVLSASHQTQRNVVPQGKDFL